MLETITGLLDLGWDVRVLARVCELDSHAGLQWVRIRTPRRPFVVAFPLFALLAGAVLAATRRNRDLVVALGAIIPNRVDLAIVQFCHAAFVRHEISRPSRNTFLHRLHNRVSQRLALALERWCYRPERLKQMIAVSELVKLELETFYDFTSNAISVIPNGVDLDRFRPNAEVGMSERDRLGLSRDDSVALFVGGDWQRKGLDIAIAAAARAGWTLLVVGRGDATDWGAKARAAGAQVVFCGHVTTPERIYCAADAFVLPSRYEGFALVTIEAAASGLPLLVTEATGAAALAEMAGIGPLPHDVGAFSAELTRLGRDPELRAEFGGRARAAAEDLSWPRIVSAYATVYGDVASAAGG
jgi:UDP-glucose:(heptosyl)LPS alpha-1,3-glucosyltransferase